LARPCVIHDHGKEDRDGDRWMQKPSRRRGHEAGDDSARAGLPGSGQFLEGNPATASAFRPENLWKGTKS
jgi:hypothetical protein